MNYTDADEYCQVNYGSYLATFYSSSDVTHARSICDSADQNCWFGLNGKDMEGTFVYTSGETYDPSIADWGYYYNADDYLIYEPNGGVNENCVEISTGFCDEWNDVPCSSVNQYPLCGPLSPPLWTDYYGGAGGSCSATLEASDDDAYITQICTRSGSLLDAIQVDFSNGESSGYVGGTGGSIGCYSVNQGECFSSVTLNTGSLVDSISFGTSDGDTSPTWGGPGGSQYMITYGDDYCISKIDACSGDNIDRLRFYFQQKGTLRWVQVLSSANILHNNNQFPFQRIRHVFMLTN